MHLFSMLRVLTPPFVKGGRGDFTGFSSKVTPANPPRSPAPGSPQNQRFCGVVGKGGSFCRFGLLPFSLCLTLFAPLALAQAPSATVSTVKNGGYQINIKDWPADKQAALVASAAMPELINNSVNYGGSRRGFIEGDVLYVADWFSGLHLYDISEPLKPKHLSVYHTQGSPKGVWLQDGYAFVGDDDHGVQIIDVHDPRKPTLLSSLPTPGLAYSLRIQGKTLYLADHRGGFHVVDISDLKNPRMIGSLDTPGKVWGLEVRGDLAFLADDRAGLLVVSLADPAQPRQIGAFAPGGAAEDVLLHGDVAYVAFYDQGLMALDIHDPSQPRLLGQLRSAGNARGLERVGDTLYLADWQAGLAIINIQDPQHPTLLGSLDTPGAAWGVKLRDQYAYVLDWWGGLQVLDIKDPSKPSLAASYHAQGKTLDVVAADGFAFVATGTSLQIFDTQTPLNPIWINSVDLPAEKLLLAGATLYVAAAGKLQRIDLSDPFQPGSPEPVPLMGAGNIERMQWNQDWLYIMQKQKLYRIGIKPGSEERQLLADSRILFSFWPRGAQTLDFTVSDNHLLLLTSKGIQIFEQDTAQKLRPVAREASSARRLQWQGDHLLLMEAQVLRIAQMQKKRLVELAQIPFANPLVDVQWLDQRLFALDTHGDFWQFDLSAPQSPRLQAMYPGLGAYPRFSVHGQGVLLAGQPMLGSLKLLPTLRQDSKAGKLRIHLTKDTPLGAYDLLGYNPQNGAVDIFKDAFTIKAPSGGKKFTQADFQKAMRQRK